MGAVVSSVCVCVCGAGWVESSTDRICVTIYFLLQLILGEMLLVAERNHCYECFENIFIIFRFLNLLASIYAANCLRVVQNYENISRVKTRRLASLYELPEF